MKERTFEEMENDLSNQKIFDMLIQIKGLSLLAPEYGIYTQSVHFILLTFHLVLF
jgi:hypothetical protein